MKSIIAAILAAYVTAGNRSKKRRLKIKSEKPRKIDLLNYKFNYFYQQCDWMIDLIEENFAEQIADLQDDIVKLETDFFYVNDEPFAIPNTQGTFSSAVLTLANPGEFCVAAGQTVDMFANVTINN